MAISSRATTLSSYPGNAERLHWLRENWHVLLTAVLAATLVPSIRRTGLPTRFDWGIFGTYWIGLALQSVFLGVALCAFGIPFEQGLGPWWNRVRREKLRLVAALPLAALLIFLFGTWKGLVLLVDAIALIEFIDRTSTDAASKFISVFLPAAYVFVGLIVAFG